MDPTISSYVLLVPKSNQVDGRALKYMRHIIGKIRDELLVREASLMPCWYQEQKVGVAHVGNRSNPLDS